MLPAVSIVSGDDQYQKAIAIRKCVFVDEQKVPLELEVDSYEKSSVHFLCFLGDNAVGTGRIRKKGPLIKFERIATLPQYRGKNLGLLLMSYMQKYVETGFPELLPYMHAQTSAMGFYTKLGWIQVGRNFLEAGIDHVAMALPGKLNDRQFCEALLSDTGLPAPLYEYISLKK